MHFLGFPNNFISKTLFLLILTCNFSCKQSNFFNLKNGDLLFQDLDSSPLCDAIEKVTQGVNNQDFSHVGICIKKNSDFSVTGEEALKVHLLIDALIESSQKGQLVKI